MELLIEAPLDKAHLDQVIKVRVTLLEEKQVQLINFLRENTKVFTWLPKDMIGIDPNVTQHHFNISPKT